MACTIPWLCSVLSYPFSAETKNKMAWDFCTFTHVAHRQDIYFVSHPQGRGGGVWIKAETAVERTIQSAVSCYHFYFLSAVPTPRVKRRYLPWIVGNLDHNHSFSVESNKAPQILGSPQRACPSKLHLCTKAVRSFRLWQTWNAQFHLNTWYDRPVMACCLGVFH